MDLGRRRRAAGRAAPASPPALPAGSSARPSALSDLQAAQVGDRRAGCRPPRAPRPRPIPARCRTSSSVSPRRSSTSVKQPAARTRLGAPPMAAPPATGCDSGRRREHRADRRQCTTAATAQRRCQAPAMPPARDDGRGRRRTAVAGQGRFRRFWLLGQTCRPAATQAVRTMRTRRRARSIAKLRPAGATCLRQERDVGRDGSALARCGCGRLYPRLSPPGRWVWRVGFVVSERAPARCSFTSLVVV